MGGGVSLGCRRGWISCSDFCTSSVASASRPFPLVCEGEGCVDTVMGLWGLILSCGRTLVLGFLLFLFLFYFFVHLLIFSQILVADVL